MPRGVYKSLPHMPTHKDPNGDRPDTECFSSTYKQQPFVANLRNSVIYNSYFLTYTMLNVNSNIAHIYSCIGTNPSLVYVRKTGVTSAVLHAALETRFFI